MKVIYKYEIPLNLRGTVDVDMPRGAQILHVDKQGDRIYAWALVNPNAPTETREFRIMGTGRAVPDADFESEGLSHLGTVMADPFVWHIFKVKR